MKIQPAGCKKPARTINEKLKLSSEQAHKLPIGLFFSLDGSLISLIELVKLMHKICSGLVPTALKEEFIASTPVHNYNTRLQTKGNYYLPPAKTSYGQKILGFRGFKFWTN